MRIALHATSMTALFVASMGCVAIAQDRGTAKPTFTKPAIVKEVNHRADGFADSVLDIGSPAPTLDRGQQVQGPPVLAPARNQVYVVEFSGTNCLPCIQSIPILEKLKKTYSKITFLTIFQGSRDEVRSFLGNAGQDISGRVIADTDGSLYASWSKAAGVRGIPNVFVVDGSSNIAWIGHPRDLEKALPAIVNGKHQYNTDLVDRMGRVIHRRQCQLREFEWKRRDLAARENEGAVTQLIQYGEYENAIKAIDRILNQCADLEIADALRARKLFVLGRMKGCKSDAYHLALELVTDASMAEGVSKIQYCHYLLNQFSDPKNLDPDERIAAMVQAYLNLVDQSSLTMPDCEEYVVLVDRINKMKLGRGQKE